MKSKTKNTNYDLNNTIIEQGGVFRCCLETVASEYKDEKVQIGFKSQCQHCKGKFTLVKRTEKRPAWANKQDWARPIWKPNWQLNNKNT
ncbi:MAG: hypothetical protein Q7R95_11320 [bacterium]|nr:hypothetical protein [bacterium]